MTTIKASHKLHQAISHHDIQLVLIFAITSHYDHHKDHHEISIFILIISISMMMSLTSLMASTFTIDIQQLQPRLSTKMKKKTNEPTKSSNRWGATWNNWFGCLKNLTMCMVALNLVDSHGRLPCFVFDIYIFRFENLPETIKCKMRKLILIRLSQKHS